MSTEAIGMPGAATRRPFGETVQAEQVRLLYRARGVLPVNLVVAVVTAIELRSVYPTWMLAAWLSAFIIVIGLRETLRYFYRTAERPAEDAGKWGWLFTAGALATGILWGLCGSIVVMDPSPTQIVFAVFILGGMMAAGIVSNSSYRPAMMVFMLPAMTPLIAMLFVDRDAAHIEMALMLIAFTSVLMVVGRNINRSIIENIRLRVDESILYERLRASQAEALKVARYDVLTGLANRGVFVEALEEAIARARLGDNGFAVIYLDLDHFKDVNDTLGHPVGDELLRAVADRLRLNTRATDTVARFGGDEFAVIVADIKEPADVAIVADKLIKAIAAPFSIQGNEIHSGASIGIDLYGPDAKEAEVLLSHADVALYRTKSEGRGSYRFFTDAMDVEVRTRVTLGSELRAAIDADQLFLMYQPQVAIDSGRITGLEALVRWRHPERGLIPPDQFIPLAEKIGIVAKLGHWVLSTACTQAKAWLDAGVPPVRIGVNLSALQFKTPFTLERDILATLAEAGLPSRWLELELTETILMETFHEHSELLMNLRRSGITIAIDDFGTGYSSLDYLRRFPVDRIKIAQNFVRHLETGSGDVAIVKATIGLARELGIAIIAEGVETREQVRLLKAWGCGEAQGFYFARPLTDSEVVSVLREGTVRPQPALAHKKMEIKRAARKGTRAA